MSRKKKRQFEQKTEETSTEFSSEDFEFARRDEERIYDKKFETKPVGFFRDAMKRFAKNRYNVYATIILLTLVLLAIFVPAFTTKNITGQEPQLRFLPPRIPVVEHLGIADGTSRVENVRVDPDTVDLEEDFGLPSEDRYRHEYIVEDSVEANYRYCDDIAESCFGGQNVLTHDGEDTFTILEAPEFWVFSDAENPVVEIDIESMSDNPLTELTVFIGDEELGTITEAGTYTFDVDPQTSRLHLEFDAVANEYVSLNSVTLSDDAEEDPLYFYEGYDLAFWSIDGEQSDASYERRDGREMRIDFDFDEYEAAFGQREQSAYSSRDYYALIEEYDEVCEKTVDPDDPERWTFSEGCPVIEVKGQSRPIEWEGEEYYTYHVVLDYAVYQGFDDTPYFLFGTTSNGRDLFAVSWRALRTSLFIGVTASLVNITIGIIYGSIEGYYGGKIDLLLERFAEVMGRIPWLVTLSIASALLGPGVFTLFVILIFSGWIGISGITRTQFYRYKRREYVLASRTLGAKDRRLIFRHILPNGIGTIITTSVLSIPMVIFIESTISYLGFGIGHGVDFNVGPVEFSGVSIGVLLADGQAQMYANPYLTVAPALIIAILMITFNMFGNALRDAFNPSLRGVEE